MRTDVKIGLIAAFVVVLAVIIYFVTQGNGKHEPQTASANAAASAKSSAPAEGLTITPPLNTPVAPVPSPLPTPHSDTSLADASASVPLALAQGPVADTPSHIGAPTTGASLIPPGGSHTTMPAGGMTPLGGGMPSSLSSPATGPSSSFIPGMGPGGFSPSGSGMGASGFGSTGTPGRGTGSGSMSPSVEFGGTTRPGIGNTRGSTGRSNLGGLGSAGNSSFEPMGGSSLTGATTYSVQKGDTFGILAKKFGVTIKAIQSANPSADSSHLSINQKLNIPAAGSSSTVTPPTASTRSSSHTSAHAAAAASGSPKPGSEYTVQKGDTLTKIAKAAYGDGSASEVQKIFHANRGELADVNSLKQGETIKIP